MNKINLVIPPSPYLIDDLVFPNLGTLYLSAILKQHNYNVSVIDLHGHAEDWREVLAKYRDINAVWGISCVTPEFSVAVQILKEIKSQDPYTDVVIGGPMATCDYRACLFAGFSKVVIGEGEKAILKIMEGCKDKVLKQSFIDNLDDVPFPDRRAIDLSRYHYEIEGKKATNILTSRGCPWSKCRFCCQIWNHQIRYRSAENVINELKVIHNMGFDAVMISDDEFFAARKRDLKICKGLKNLNMSYRCLTRSDLVTEEIAKVAAYTGCSEMLLGVESGSDKILAIIKKGITKKTHKYAIKILKENGIRVKALFMIGLPGESNDTIEETKQFIEDTEPDICEFTIYTPYQNSVFWDEGANYEILFDKLKILNTSAWYKGMKGKYVSHVSTPFLTEGEIVREREEMERRFGEKIKNRGYVEIDMGSLL